MRKQDREYLKSMNAFIATIKSNSKFIRHTIASFKKDVSFINERILLEEKNLIIESSRLKTCQQEIINYNKQLNKNNHENNKRK